MEDSVLCSLSDTRRRTVLRLLRDRASPVGLQELATHVVAEERDRQLVDVDREEVDAVRVSLVHQHLPRLAGAGLVEWDPAAGSVAVTAHPALSDPRLDRVLGTEAVDWDAVLACLADGRRRTALAVLEDCDGAIARAELAKMVVALERSDVERDQPTSRAKDLLTDLHHRHLPMLHEAGLVEYDTDLGTVAYEGHPELDGGWLDAGAEGTTGPVVPAAARRDDIWTIEGREHVIARGQSLFDRAEEELFLLFTTDGLLEEGCIRRLEDAVDRGVDVYLGSQTRAVRDLVRERVPGATIWEPQMDWLNLPPEYERVGRLVFADREAVMLATLGDETEAGVPAETAITGTGTDNPLVVLLRELLGTRLDHLDAQSEDFLDRIPL